MIIFFIFLYSCVSPQNERVLNSFNDENNYWYAGFDQRLEKEDLAWSLKFYYTSVLDNLRIYGGYTTIYENNNRNYLKDKPDKANSIFPHLEELLLVLFPSKDAALSVNSRSISNINSLILSSMNSSESYDNSLNNISMIPFILNNIYELIDSAENIILNNSSDNNLKKNPIENLIFKNKEEFEKKKKTLQIMFTEELKKNFSSSSRNILKIKNGILDPVFELLTKMIDLDPIKESLKYKQLTEEKELIKHAFMKWAIMHVGIDKKKIENFVADLIFFKPKTVEKSIISKKENLFMKKQVSLNGFNSIYSLHTHLFEYGGARIFNGEIEGGKIFSDCVETALRHFFNYILWKNNDFYIYKSLNSKLKEYYSELTYERALQHDIIERTAWNKVVSNISGAKYKIDDKNELKSSVSNIIYIIKYLLFSDISVVYKDLTKEDAYKEIESIKEKLNKLTKKSIQLEVIDHVLETANINVDNFLQISIKDETTSSKIIEVLHQPTQKFKGDVESLHILEYSFLSNYYIFDKKIDIYYLFSSILTKNTNIDQFLEKCEKLENGDLEKYSKYIGNVMYFVGRNTLSLEDWFYHPDFLKLFEKLKNNDNHQFLNNFLKGITGINVNKYNMPDYIEFVKNNLLIILQSNKKELLRIGLDLKDIFNGFPKNILEYVLQCKNLEELKLQNIKAKGSIPLGLSSLVNLRELDLFKNEFTGNISTEIWSLKNLKYLNLSSNNLTGEIPKESYAFLRLDLSRNQLKGKIPFQLEKFKINPQIDTEKKEYDLLVENELNE